MSVKNERRVEFGRRTANSTLLYFGPVNLHRRRLNWGRLMVAGADGRICTCNQRLYLGRIGQGCSAVELHPQPVGWWDAHIPPEFRVKTIIDQLFWGQDRCQYSSTLRCVPVPGFSLAIIARVDAYIQHRLDIRFGWGRKFLNWSVIQAWMNPRQMTPAGSSQPIWREDEAKQRNNLHNDYIL